MKENKKSEQEEKIVYYSLDNILSYKADYNIIYGERSNGKTTSVLHYALEDFVKSGYKHQLAVVRRFSDDFVGKNGSQLFDGEIWLKWVSELSKGEYNSIWYFSQRWYLTYYDDKGEQIRRTKVPFAFGFSINSEEHYKSTSYPNVKTILFDEFITRGYYLPEEFIKFTSLLSTIIRLRDDVKIFLCGNSINKFCPYFNEMGLTNVKTQKMGTIDLYTYGDSGLRVAVEYSDLPSKKKKSNKYFAFNNPKLNMIKNGVWELAIYPHLPCKYIPKEVIFSFYINFDGDMLQGNFIIHNNIPFIYFHYKTTPIKEDNENLVFQCDIDYRPNYRVNITKPCDRISKIIAEFIAKEKLFFQSNEVGEIYNNYYKWCKVH